MYIYSDGGRKAAGFPDNAIGDCVVRAIAIALERDYREVYEDLHERTLHYVATKRDRIARGIAAGSGDTPCNGVHRPVYDALLKEASWVWTNTAGIGTGAQMHLRPEELPLGRLILSLKRHLVAAIDGMPYDTHDPTHGGRRAVYGFWQPPQVWSYANA